MNKAHINLDPETTPGFIHAKGLTRESADAAGQALESNRVNHIFTSDKALIARLHNHVVYHVLSLWAMGASPQQIYQHSERNVHCALPPPKVADEETVKSLSDPENLKKTLGQEECYQDLIVFFEHEIERLGVDQTLQEYLLGDSEFARSSYPRVYHGYVHAIMHVGLGLEFSQPSILAEGLAETVVHNEPWYTEYHELCRTVAASTTAEDRLSLLQAYTSCVNDPVIAKCMDWDLAVQFKAPEESWEAIMADKNFRPPVEEPWRHRAWGRAGKNLAAITGRWKVDPDEDLERAAAEVINTSTYVTCSAMLPPHEFRVDFFLMHVVNAAYWLQAYLRMDSISRVQKSCMIEDTGRLLTFMAAGVGMPSLHPEVLEQHIIKANGGKGKDWDELFATVCHHADDGHMIKFIRALANGEKVCKPFEGQNGFPMRQNLFLKAANAVLDNSSTKPMAFLAHFDLLRAVGLPEAWAEVPLQTKVANGA
ncbi:hypothetical protein FQN54_006770 [Arachnomyces sp. PD_36]|nr:hypothetical protein FQN54_006770 [Arachnomyces sp. PD_36]